MELDISNLANGMMGGNSKEKQDKKFQNDKKKSDYNYQSNGNYQNNKGYQSNREHQNNKGYQNNNYQNNRKVPYVGAPYNFVSFSDDVYEYDEKQLTSHATFSDDLFTGEIEYEITAQTPIIIDNGEGKFCKNSYGQYAIPGSTMRGLIRNNVQVLGLASMNDDIDDYALMYRKIADGKDKERYDEILGSDQITVDNNELSVLLNVKAGYIKNEQGKYVIYQTCVDSIKSDYEEMNYYIVSERTIVEKYLLAKENKGIFSFEFFEQEGKMQHKIDEEFIEYKDEKGNIHYKGTPQESYKPYFQPISYNLAGDRTITAVGKVGKYKHQGYVISTGKMNEKKAIYIIPKLDSNKPYIPIPEKGIRAFQIDIKKRKNTLTRFGKLEFFDLPEEGKLKPVFYIQLGGRLYFGFTPRLRLFYDNTVKQGLNPKHKPEVLDYTKAIFGYTSKTSSYKSRVSFSDALIVKDTKELEGVRLILAEPKSTSYSDYLKPVKGQAVTYNNDFELRGVKQYWLRDKVVPVQAKNIKAESNFSPLQQGTRFKGKVRFYNLKKEELGLLLWGIKLNKNSWMNVGKAKAYGYGNISLNIVSAKKVDLKDAYASGVLNLDPLKDIDVDDFILNYKEKISKFLGGRNIDNLKHIKEFFAMKDSTKMPEKDKIRYMDINAKEYQKRKDKVLPSIEETMEKSKK